MMATHVLVHGAWHGGWCWRKVTPLLRAAGHEVYTPTLTGLGERVHLGGPHIDLEMHIQDIVNVLEYGDLRDVILTGHSYGGMVITGVAERAADRLSHLIYLDAFVPSNGESLLGYMPPERGATMTAVAKAEGGVGGCHHRRWPGSASWMRRIFAGRKPALGRNCSTPLPSRSSSQSIVQNGCLGPTSGARVTPPQPSPPSPSAPALLPAGATTSWRRVTTP
jgi:pimeloyl-ACP methyl ester carboxylesterase